MDFTNNKPNKSSGAEEDDAYIKDLKGIQSLIFYLFEDRMTIKKT